ncbi:MAG: hypothetical protein HQK60_07735, partial [Deltaproteobacteria bacterium]|nr:hypothetical protein [Deltaproteobacteria bacterium]
VEVAAPEIPAILFFAPHPLETIIGKKLSEAEMITARYEPKKVLDTLMKESGIGSELDLISRLDQAALVSLAGHPLVKHIVDFLRDAAGKVEVLPGRQIEPTPSHVIGAHP